LQGTTGILATCLAHWPTHLTRLNGGFLLSWLVAKVLPPHYKAIIVDRKPRYLASDKRYVCNAYDDPQIGSVANQLVHPTTDFGHQKTVIQCISLSLCPSANFQKNPLVESNDAADVLIQFSLHMVLGCL